MRKAILSGVLGLAVVGLALATPAASQARDRHYGFSFSHGPSYGHYHRGHSHGYSSGLYHRPQYGGGFYNSRPSYFYAAPYRGWYGHQDYYYAPRAQYYYDPYCR